MFFQEERGEKRKFVGMKDKVWVSVFVGLEEQFLEVLENSRYGEESVKMFGIGFLFGEFDILLEYQSQFFYVYNTVQIVFILYGYR